MPHPDAIKPATLTVSPATDTGDGIVAVLTASAADGRSAVLVLDRLTIADLHRQVVQTRDALVNEALHAHMGEALASFTDARWGGAW